MVLAALLRRGLCPRLVVLPEYPPAAKPAASVDLAASGGKRELLRIGAGIEIAYIPSERQGEGANSIRALGVDFLLVACWPDLIGRELIGSARCAALNLHPSLLPRYPGPDPVRQQIIARERRLGVTLHLLDERFDHGDIVAQARLEEGAGKDAATLEVLCAELGVLIYADALAAHPNWRTVPQNSL